jgi:hypothetical protein
MDLNDPRRRLQVLNSQSPSLRVATQPQVSPTIQIAQPQNTPQISLPKSNPVQTPQAAPNTYKQISYTNPKNKTIFGWNAAALLPKSLEKTYTIGGGKDVSANPQDFLKTFDNQADDVRAAYVSSLQKQQATDPVAAQTLKLLSDNGRFKGGVSDFAAGANDKLYGGLNRGFLRGVDFVLPGHNTFGLEGEANAIDPSKNGTQQYTKTGKVGEKVGSVEKGVVDAATLAFGSGAAEQAASKVPAFAKLVETLGGGNKAQQIAAKALSIIPGSLGGSAVSIDQTAGKGEKQNILSSILQGTAADLALPVVGGIVGKGLKFLRGGGDEAKQVFSSLVNSTDESAIKRQLEKLAPDANRDTVDTLSKYIATEKDPNAVQGALNVLQSDGAPQQTLAPGLFDPSAPPQSYLNEHLPGTHVPGTPDPVQTISDKAKTFATPEEFKKYVDGLTGEEKAVADAGLSGKSADEFYNTVKPQKEAPTNSTAPQGDLPPEDIQAIKDAGGTPPPVYNADTVLHLPQQGVHAKLTKEQAAFLADENKNIPWSETDRPHLTAGDKVREATKEISQEELAKLSPNAGIALENADKNASVPNAQAVEDVSKAQTGTSEGQVTGSGETTNAGAAQGDIPSKVDESTANATNTPETAGNGSQGNLPQKASDIVPNADPETQKAVQEVLDNLNSAQKSYDANVPVRAQEKAQRGAAASAAYEAAGGGEAGVRAKLGALKGKYSEGGFTPVAASEGTQKTILDDIQNSNLRDFEKLNTQNAIRKIWGANTDKPTPSDITYIRKYFGNELADSVEQAVEESPKTWKDKLASIAGTPRALMATGDLSYGLRQGAPLGARFPKQWANAEKESAKYAVNKDYFNREMETIRNDDSYELIADKMHVQLPAADKGVEEAFAGADLAEKIPGAKHVVQGADRAYSGMATRLRFDAAKQAVDAAGGPDAYLKVMQDTFGDKADDAMKAYGEVINTLSGRGGKAGGLVEQHMKTLSTTLFAPRLWAAKLNTLNPYWYARLAKSNPTAAKLAVRANATFLAMAGGVLSAAAAAGAEVEWDPRSADFAKIKVGNTRYDILGGLQQNIRLGAQLATGEKINSSTGELQTLGDGFGKPTRKDILYQAFESKENPLLAYAGKLLEGKDAGGNPVNPVTEGAKLLIPLNAQGVYETAKDLGNGDAKSIAKSTAMNIPGVFGVGVQTYGQTATKDQGTDSTGKLTFKGKITPDMVLGADGKPMLDGKGKPVKVGPQKNPDGTTTAFADLSPTQQQALLDSTKKTALKNQFTQAQSKDDQALMKLSDNQLKDYVKAGTIDQSKYDHIQRLQKGAGDYGQEMKADDGLKSDSAVAFSKHFNSMDKKDQNYFLEKQGPDATSKSITDEVNKQRSAGLDEFKPSNKLAQLYTKYEADINQHDGSVDGKDAYTDVDLRNKAKTFQTSAYKLNYSSEQNDIFSEGGSSDLKTLIDNKEIDKADLDAAMKMDEQLYNSGLTGSLKFSKKFRESYGYNVPDGGSGPNGGGGGSSKDSVNAHLLDYMPNASSAKQGGDQPTFSSKRRTNGISFKNVNLPSKSAKKVSIKL